MRHGVRGVLGIGSLAVLVTVTGCSSSSPQSPGGNTSGAEGGATVSTVFPSAATTGVPEGMTLRPTGDLTIDDAGTVIDGYDITGVVRVESDDVVIRNSRIRGAGWFSVEVEPGLTGVVIEYCDIDGQGEQGKQNSMGVMGPATIRGNDISQVENGITPASGSVVEGNYVHDLLAPGDPHYDGIQIDGNVSDVVIRGNRVHVDHPQTAAVMIANTLGPATDISVENNYLAGGSYTVYADAQFDGGPIDGVRFVGNTLERGHWGYASIQGNAPEISGNVDAVSGAPVPLADGH
jgi:hypothetical protein